MLSRADNETLTRVGPGIPMGDLFRGFWLPALMPSELPSPDCPPVGIRLVGEELGGRTVHLHPQEALLQAARAFQTSPAFAEYRRLRQAAEHRIARLVQLGIRQARYFGRAKTLFQLCMAAAAANLTLLAYGAAHGSNDPGSAHLFVVIVAVGLLTSVHPAVSRSAPSRASSSPWNPVSDLGTLTRAA